MVLNLRSLNKYNLIIISVVIEDKGGFISNEHIGIFYNLSKKGVKTLSLLKN